MFVKNSPVTAAFAIAIAIAIAAILSGKTATASSFTSNVSSLATGAFAIGVDGVLMLLRSAKYLFDLLLAQPKPSYLAVCLSNWHKKGTYECLSLIIRLDKVAL